MEDKKITRKEFVTSIFSLCGVLALSQVETVHKEAGRIFNKNTNTPSVAYGTSFYGNTQKNG